MAVAAIIDNLPADATDYYLWIASWPDTTTVRAAYRSTPRGRALHRRIIATGYRDLTTRDWTPLLLLNAIPVAEELFMEIAAAPHPIDTLRDFMVGFWEHVAALPRPSRLLHDPTIREPFREWATTVAIPWISSSRFAELWSSTILPTWEGVRAAPLPTIPGGVAAELAAVAWAPERVVDWCLPYDDVAELRERWIGAAVQKPDIPLPCAPPCAHQTPHDDVCQHRLL
jgi:hypothetical protein